MFLHIYALKYNYNTLFKLVFIFLNNVRLLLYLKQACSLIGQKVKYLFPIHRYYFNRFWNYLRNNEFKQNLVFLIFISLQIILRLPLLTYCYFCCDWYKFSLVLFFLFFRDRNDESRGVVTSLIFQASRGIWILNTKLPSDMEFSICDLASLKTHFSETFISLLCMRNIINLSFFTKRGKGDNSFDNLKLKALHLLGKFVISFLTWLSEKKILQMSPMSAILMT